MYNRLSKLQKGFTLIELLVVVSIIGILAVLLILAINPLEQVRKSRDSAAFQDADELNRALQRFYTANGCYPWDWTAAGTPPCQAQAITWPVALSGLAGGTTTAYGITTTLPKLGSTGSQEVQSGLITRLSAYPSGATTIGAAYLSLDATGNPRVGYYPQSNAYHLKATYTNDCTTAGTNFVCIPGTTF